MLLRKINRGLYEVMDAFENNYVVQDSRVESAKSLPTGVKTNEGHWGIWFENPLLFSGPSLENDRLELSQEYVFINNDKTLKECLFAVALLEEAQEINHKD